MHKVSASQGLRAFDSVPTYTRYTDSRLTSVPDSRILTSMTSSRSLTSQSSGDQTDSSQNKTPSPFNEPSPIIFSQRSQFSPGRSEEIVGHSDPSYLESPGTDSRFTRLKYDNTGPRLVFNWDSTWSQSETRHSLQESPNSHSLESGGENTVDPRLLSSLIAPYEKPETTGTKHISKYLGFLGSGDRPKSDRALLSSLDPRSSVAVVSATSSRADPEPFDEKVIPTQAQLSDAASLTVVSEAGIPINFGSLWFGQKTIVTFIRHFWCVSRSRPSSEFDIHLMPRCPNCQDYMASISENLSAETLRKACIKLVIISNGSPRMIKTYRGKPCRSQS